MLERDRERILSRILAGKDRLILKDNGIKKYFWLKTPSPIDKLISCEIYDEVYSDATLNDLYSEEETIDLLINKKLWSKKDEEDLQKAVKNIDKLKVGLYKAIRKREKETIRKGLDKTRELIKELSSKKYQLYDKTIEFVAATTKTKYLIGKNLLREDGSQVWLNDDFLNDDSQLLNDAFEEYISNKITENQIRELSRTDPWRPIWICRTVQSNIFDFPATLLSDDQKAIIAWSKLYDSCYEDNERPSEEIIEEDDAFDGWLINRRNEREKESKGKFENVLKVENDSAREKLANCNEVFISACNPGEDYAHFSDDELAEIDNLNNSKSYQIKQERMKAIKEKGKLREDEMPDTQHEIQMALNKLRTS